MAGTKKSRWLRQRSTARSLTNRRLTCELLESRRVMAAPVGHDDHFFVDQNDSLLIDSDNGAYSTGIVPIRELDAPDDVDQIQYSPDYKLLFLREDNGDRSVIHILDARTGTEIESYAARKTFRDIDLTPDGRYLYAADAPYNSPAELKDPPHWIHRYDLEARSWQIKQVVEQVYGIEAVDENRFLVRQRDGYHHVIVLYDFGPASEEAVTELSRTAWAESSYRFVYDHRSSQVFYSREISGAAVATLDGDVLTDRDGTWRYDTGLLPTVSTDGAFFYAGPNQVDAADINTPLTRFPEIIAAASSELAFGRTAFYDVQSGERLGTLGFDTWRYFVTEDGSELWAFDPGANKMHHYALHHRNYGLLANDVDPDGDALSIELVAAPIHGTVQSIRSDGSVVYLPGPDFTGIDQFTYRAFDGSDYSETTTVTITVLSAGPRGTAPDADDDSFEVDMGGTLTVPTGTTDSSAVHEVGQILTVGPVHQIEYSFQFGLVITREGTYDVRIYDAATGEHVGGITRAQRLYDMDLTPDGRYLFVTERPENPRLAHWVHRFDLVSRTRQSRQAMDAGAVAAVSADRLLLLEPSDYGGLTLNDFGNHAGTLVKALSRVEAREEGGIEYDHQTGRVYHASEGSRNNTVYAYWLHDDTLSTAENRSSKSSGGAMLLSSDGRRLYAGGLQIEAFDVKNNLITFPEPIRAATSEIAFGGASYYDANTGSVLGSLDIDASVQFVSSDGRHLWVSSGESNVLTQYVLGSHPGGILANDSDLQQATFSAGLVDGPVHGQLTLNDDGSFTYVPDEGFEGVDTFSYQASDGQLQSAPALVTIQVLGPNDAPTISPIPDQVINEDQPLGPLVITLGDPDTDLSHLTVWATASDTTLVPTENMGVAGTGEIRQLFLYPATDQFGTTTITIHVSDGELITSAQFTLTVNAINDPPRAIDDSYSTPQNDRLIVDAESGLLANDNDPEGDAYSLELVGSTQHGELTVGADGSFTYSPNRGFAGIDTFTYRVTDAMNRWHDATVTIDVVDVTPPRVVASSIVAGDIVPSGRVEIRVRFSEALQETSIDSDRILLRGSTTGQYLPSTVTYDSFTWTLTTVYEFLPSHVFVFTLVGGKGQFIDQAGWTLDGEPSDWASAPSGDGIAGGDFFVEFTVGQPAQIIMGPAAPVIVDSGGRVRLPIVYSTSDGNSAANGLAIRVHYDSSFMTFDTASSVYTNGLTAGPIIQPDSDDLDRDPRTDVFVLLIWDGTLANGWPGTGLPIELLGAEFTVSPNGPFDAPNSVRFTAASVANGYQFISAPLEVIAQPVGLSLDVDGNGVAEAETDAVVIQRFLFGLRGPALIDGAVDQQGGTRTDAEAIERYLSDARLSMLDVDGNGLADALTDGVLIQRYLSGERDDSLVDGVLGADAVRNSAEAVARFLDSYSPRDMSPRAGDANRDGLFDQLDLVQVLQGGKYRTGQLASWGEGDWNGDGVFDQLDIVAALATGRYLRGSDTAAPASMSSDDASVAGDGSDAEGLLAADRFFGGLV